MKGLPARAAEIFAVHRASARGDLDAMHARNAAAGRLQSGATAKEAILIAESAGSAALDQLHAEVAKILEQRGRQWGKAMTTIEDALDAFIGSWREWLDPSFSLARAHEGAAAYAVNDRLEKAAASLRSRHRGFRDGWTAPRGKPWRERHPALWAAALAVMGAVLGQAAPVAWRTLFPPPVATPATPR